MENSDPSPDNKLKSDFKLEEYKTLQEFRRKCTENLNQIEIYCIGAAAAISAFDIAQTNPLVRRWTGLMPLLIFLIGSLRYRDIDGDMRAIDDYLIDIEKRYDLGWAQFSKTRESYLFSRSRKIFWFMLLLFGLGMFIFGIGPWPQIDKLLNRFVAAF